MNIIQSAENAISADVKKVGAFFAGIVEKGGAASTPSGQAVVQAAGVAVTNLTNAAAAAEAALPAVANVGVNFVLGLVPGGAAFDTLVDTFIDQVVAGLLARKSTAAPAAAQ